MYKSYSHLLVVWIINYWVPNLAKMITKNDWIRLSYGLWNWKTNWSKKLNGFSCIFMRISNLSWYWIIGLRIWKTKFKDCKQWGKGIEVYWRNLRPENKAWIKSLKRVVLGLPNNSKFSVNWKGSWFRKMIKRKSNWNRLSS